MNTQKEIYKRLIRVISNLYSIKESGKSEALSRVNYFVRFGDNYDGRLNG